MLSILMTTAHESHHVQIINKSLQLTDMSTSRFMIRRRFHLASKKFLDHDTMELDLDTLQCYQW